MLSHEEMISLQAQKHELIEANRFRSKEEYVLHLIHTVAYEQAAKLSRNKNVLDLGCNTGYGTKIVSNYCNEIIGVDVSPKAISTARKLYGESGMKFCLIDGNRLPFKDNKFDLIISFQVIEHIVNLKKYIFELKRVFSPHGVALFTTPNSLHRLYPGMKPWNPFHVREYSPTELNGLLSGYFLKVGIYGLFAEPALYSIEFNRIMMARENAMKRIEDAYSLKYSLRAKAKKLLPEYLLNIIKRVRDTIIGKISKTNGNETLSDEDKDFMERYGMDDLYYDANDLENALDLLAICSDE